LIAVALAFLNGALILPDRLLPDGAVLVDGDRIRWVGPRSQLRVPKGSEEIDARGGFIGPGFVDIHVHGGKGADYMDGTADAVRIANRCHAAHGTTTIFPTTTTGTPAEIDRMLDACAEVQKGWSAADGARIGGVHFYGPYFAPDKVGCHPVTGRRDPDPKEYRRALGRGIVRVATAAAELPGADGFYREARRRHCLVTCGHSNASWSEMSRAFRAGVRHVDHFWCAMSSVPGVRQRLGYPMQGSMAEFVLSFPEMSTEVLADGEHLSPELLEFAFRMKGPSRLCLVTDASRAVDMPPGPYRFGPSATGEWFTSNGKVGFQEGAGLASTVVGMDVMIRTMKKTTTATLPDIVRMASLTPAERVGVGSEIGSLEKGKRADVVVLTRRLGVSTVLIGGQRFE
jgi:N-acetylglucosamine-6-phosphate deacetylase